MKVLITGAAGFVGHYLAQELSRAGWEVIAGDISFPTPVREAAQNLELDILDRSKLKQTLSRHSPDACVHLAGKTFAPAGEQAPADMFNVNVTGTLNLLETLLENKTKTRLLTVSSAHVYGNGEPGRIIDESAPHKPGTMYAISKSSADIASLIFARHHGLDVIVARPNNHTGPKQPDCFVVPAIARQIKKMAEDGSGQPLYIGNPESSRDFLDVRDVVKAYRLLLEKGKGCNAYNIASGNQITIGSLVENICAQANTKPEIKIDPQKFRPTDHSPFLDTTRLKEDTGWSPGIPLDQTIRDILA
ncbi:MAG: NAD-dependent epimerase/dehydratase family protein [Verrucomicrobiota bacterium]